MNRTGSEVNSVLHGFQNGGDPGEQVVTVLIQDVDFALAAGGEGAINADDILTVPGVVEGVQEEDGGKQVLVEVGWLETLPLVGARQLLGTLLDTLSTWSQNIHKVRYKYM